MKFEVTQRIRHPGEVNKARYMWQNPEIIATMASDGRCLIWDRTKLPSTPTDRVTPQIELVGHKEEGFALHWNPRISGQLATASNDHTVKIWDINQYTATKSGTQDTTAPGPSSPSASSTLRTCTKPSPNPT